MSSVATVTITLKNTQSSATPTNFQVQLNINFSGYSQLDAGLGNIRFSTDFAGTSLLYAWLESAPQGTFTKGTSISAYTSSNIWVNLGSNIISANGSLTIYMQILTSGTEFDGIYWGANPLWTSTYGQYDNGANVFSFYDNFAGTTLSSKWTANGANYTVSNGLTYGSNGNYPVLLSTISFTEPYVIDWYGYGTASTSDAGIYFDSQTDTANGNANLWAQRGSTGASSGGDMFFVYTSGGYTQYGAWPYSINGNYNVYTLIANGSTLSVQTNYVTQETYTTFPTTYTSGYFGPRQLVSGDVEFWQWVRVRAYPPNGVNLAVIFGFVPINLTNSQSTATSSGFQVQLNINFSGYSQLDTDLGNIRFSTDSAGNNLLYAWLESAPQGSFEKGTSISAYTSSTVWVNLGSNTIPANGSLTIYMQILSSGTEFDGVFWGANPLWTSTYGQYDNGANVFNFYDNFAGTTLSSKWTVGTGTSGGTITVNNGLNVIAKGSTQTTMQSVNAIVSSNAIIESYGEATALGSENNLGFGIVDASENDSVNGYFNFFANSGTQFNSFYREGTSWVEQDTAYASMSLNKYYIVGIIRNESTVAPSLNYQTYSGGTSTISSSSSLYLIVPRLWIESAGDTGTLNYYWVRIRAYPPNGTNLTVNIGEGFYETMNDSYSLIDSNIIKKMGLDKGDNYTFSELMQFLDRIFISENYSVIDSGLKKTILPSKKDILTLVDDILSKSVSFEKQDAYTPAEVMVKRWITSLIDNYSVSDKGVIKNIIQNLVDGYEILETIFKKYSTSKSDSFTPEDLGLVISWLFYVNLVDSFSIVDIPSIKSLNKKLIDTLILADMAVSFYIKLNKSDNYNLSEILNRQVSFSKTDSYTFSEIMRLLGMIAISENFILDDLGINRNVYVNKLDDYSLTEFVNKFMKLHQSDEYGLNESLVKMAVKIFFDEQTAMVESIKRNIFANKKDIMSIVEMLEKDTSKGFSDNITLSETYSITLGQWDIMSLIASFFTTAGIKPVTLYDIKYYDVLRGGNSAIIYRGTSNELYVGFGREMYTDLEIVADAWIFGDNETLDALISSIHQQVEVWQPITPENQVFNDVIVWVKLLSEQNLQSRVRGVTLYRFNFQVRLYRRQQ
ncbi:MAG: hypothetical protein QXU98_06485 [Candidatus Parvarchaeota archaeon]